VPAGADDDGGEQQQVPARKAPSRLLCQPLQDGDVPGRRALRGRLLVRGFFSLFLICVCAVWWFDSACFAARTHSLKTNPPTRQNHPTRRHDQRRLQPQVRPAAAAAAAAREDDDDGDDYLPSRRADSRLLCGALSVQGVPARVPQRLLRRLQRDLLVVRRSVSL
jgi:hypothetical protein